MVGIYRIRNKVNGKIYIGQSIHIEERLKEHKFNCQNNHLRNSI